jgi:hypothetical protein
VPTDRSAVEAAVYECLASFLPEGEPFDQDTNPVCELGLTSEQGLEFACEVSRKLDRMIPGKMNPLFKEKSDRARNVGEIVDAIYYCCNLAQETQRGRN